MGKQILNLLFTLFVFTTLVVLTSAKVDLYAILGVSKTATTKEIKKAFRQLAVRWHPDKNQDNIEEARKEFSKISEAYQTLADPKKRKDYDEGVDEGSYEEGDWGEQGEDGEGFDFSEMFSKHFGGMDADEIENFDDGDDSDTIDLSKFFGNDDDEDDDNDGWTTVTYSSDDGVNYKKTSKTSKKQKKKVTSKSDFEETKTDDTDL